MSEAFVDVLAVGGKSNTLGRVKEVVEAVLEDKSRLEELYSCLFADDAWVRMRAADALEKVCRVHPEWFEPFVDRLLNEVSLSSQPSIQWHLAQMFVQVKLKPAQYQQAEQWLVARLQDKNVDWIVAANTMGALAHFIDKGTFSRDEFNPLLKLQLNHRSKSVVKKASKYLAMADE